jgi:hypothetical protein
MTFCVHDDLAPFVSLFFTIDSEQPDHQCAQDGDRDHRLVLLHPQNDLSARVAALA